MHAVAQTLSDVALSTGTRTEAALNIVHPRPVAWDTIISGINDALAHENVVAKRLPVVEFSEWFELLETKARDTKHINDIVRIDTFFSFIDAETEGDRSVACDQVDRVFPQDCRC
jgi:hypothetical protein